MTDLQFEEVPAGAGSCHGQRRGPARPGGQEPSDRRGGGHPPLGTRQVHLYERTRLGPRRRKDLHHRVRRLLRDRGGCFGIVAVRGAEVFIAHDSEQGSLSYKALEVFKPEKVVVFTRGVHSFAAMAGLNLLYCAALSGDSECQFHHRTYCGMISFDERSPDIDAKDGRITAFARLWTWPEGSSYELISPGFNGKPYISRTRAQQEQWA